MDIGDENGFFFEFPLSSIGVCLDFPKGLEFVAPVDSLEENGLLLLLLLLVVRLLRQTDFDRFGFCFTDENGLLDVDVLPTFELNGFFLGETASSYCGGGGTLLLPRSLSPNAPRTGLAARRGVYYTLLDIWWWCLCVSERIQRRSIILFFW